ncbi:hypothetical protein B0H10DRAFT_2225386 [Mycena sp. CBHHK59/15]|nr:hypothetical protein B0H10DRAFT_2225386 [Mycena sp. CBHHK59/15]
MATTASRATPPARRTSTPPSSSPPPVSSSIARGATARSAVSPRVSPPSHPAIGTGRPLGLSQAGDGQKEQLLVQVQNKDQTIATLSTENANLTSALNAAETRINELYTDQSRSELELAQRIEISENLRAQVRELEKEKRDVQRRYNEQTNTFEAERQAFYDNEQHLNLIAHLHLRTLDTEPQTDVEEEEADAKGPEAEPPKQDMDDPETEPAEMTSLRLELSTLSTSYSSLQSTLVLLQTQLVDLKRREDTEGQFDVMKQVGGGSTDDGEDDDEDEDEDASADVGSLRSTDRSVLDKVEEEDVQDVQEQNETLEQQLERSLAPPRGHRLALAHLTVRGESLADLPITGPGLDLAAELGRAENKDILDGNMVEEQDRSVLNGKKRSKKSSTGRKDFETSLKDANKALFLYASKIIDRIISQEGFEHVLAWTTKRTADTVHRRPDL